MIRLLDVGVLPPSLLTLLPEHEVGLVEGLPEVHYVALPLAESIRHPLHHLPMVPLKNQLYSMMEAALP